jgi:hypothetical protein
VRSGLPSSRRCCHHERPLGVVGPGERLIDNVGGGPLNDRLTTALAWPARRRGERHGKYLGWSGTTFPRDRRRLWYQMLA